MHWCNVADETQPAFACMQAYPENEVAWLMITAWNAGVEFHRFGIHSRMRFCQACALLVEMDNFHFHVPQPDASPEGPKVVQHCDPAAGQAVEPQALLPRHGVWRIPVNSDWHSARQTDSFRNARQSPIQLTSHFSEIVHASTAAAAIQGALPMM
jgi:hypothetical protein